jgi:hypothetical protein
MTVTPCLPLAGKTAFCRANLGSRIPDPQRPSTRQAGKRPKFYNPHGCEVKTILGKIVIATYCYIRRYGLKMTFTLLTNKTAASDRGRLLSSDRDHEVVFTLGDLDGLRGNRRDLEKCSVDVRRGDDYAVETGDRAGGLVVRNEAFPLECPVLAGLAGGGYRRMNLGAVRMRKPAAIHRASSSPTRSFASGSLSAPRSTSFLTAHSDTSAGSGSLATSESIILCTPLSPV